jgi:hypothetical protein
VASVLAVLHSSNASARILPSVPITGVLNRHLFPWKAWGFIGIRRDKIDPLGMFSLGGSRAALPKAFVRLSRMGKCALRQKLAGISYDNGGYRNDAGHSTPE